MKNIFDFFPVFNYFKLEIYRLILPHFSKDVWLDRYDPFGAGPF